MRYFTAIILESTICVTPAVNSNTMIITDRTPGQLSLYVNAASHTAAILREDIRRLSRVTSVLVFSILYFTMRLYY